MKSTGTPTTNKSNTQKRNTPPPIKHELALYDLLEAGTSGISKLTELPSYGETALPTTISELGASGFVIDRERRNHQHRHGGKTFFTWYWLADRGEALKAINRVNQLRRNRGEQPLSELIAERFAHRFPLPTRLGGDAA